MEKKYYYLPKINKKEKCEIESAGSIISCFYFHKYENNQFGYDSYVLLGEEKDKNISFLGGGCKKKDKDIIDTIIREVKEESNNIVILTREQIELSLELGLYTYNIKCKKLCVFTFIINPSFTIDKSDKIYNIKEQSYNILKNDEIEKYYFVKFNEWLDFSKKLHEKVINKEDLSNITCHSIRKNTLKFSKKRLFTMSLFKTSIPLIKKIRKLITENKITDFYIEKKKYKNNNNLILERYNKHDFENNILLLILLSLNVTQ